MNPRDLDARARENQTKYVQARINHVEKHFALMCQEFGGYTRKTARLRDKADLLSKSVIAYADSEAPSTKTGLSGFAEKLSSVQDYRQAQVDRLEYKVVQPLTLYGTTCKHKRDDLKAAFAARNKELNQQKKLEKVRQKNPGDRQQISQAESQLQKATVDATRSNKALEDEMDSFERKRLQDLKATLSEFVKIEMLFHSKVLEVYTDAWQCLNAINDEDDLEEFRNSLRPVHGAANEPRLGLSRHNSKTSLNATDQSRKSTTSRKSKDGKSHRNATNVQNFADDDDDDDDEDDDEDEDDEEDEEDDDDVYDYR